MTSIIYSLTLGSVIFLLVSATLTLKQLETKGNITDADADLYLVGKDPGEHNGNGYFFAN